MLARRYANIAVESLFVTSISIGAVGLVIVIRKISAAQELNYIYFLNILSCLVWTGASFWTRMIIKIENRKKGVRAWPGLLMFFSSMGLIFLKLVSLDCVLFTFLLAALTTAGLNSRFQAAILNFFCGIAHVVILYLYGEIILAEAILLMDILIIFTSILIGGAFAEWGKQTGMFDQARWAAAEFTQANIRLQDSMSNTEIWTRSKERIRVAREIHDTVGYALTAILVQISATKELLKVDSSKIDERLQQLEDLIRTTIKDVRKEVTVLRESELDSHTWRIKWIELCKVFADFTGIRMHIEIDEKLELVDDDLGSIFYRIIQEALTNAYRHGRASYVDVAMGFKETEKNILLRISDDGLGTDGLTMGSGLKGIRERAESIGGEAVWDTLPEKGFDLGIVIPWQPEAI